MPPSASNTATLHNFGRNVAFCPEHHEHPNSEAEVLEVLQRHRGRRIRAYGSLHAWSHLAASDDIAVNLSQLNRVVLHTDGTEPTATVEGGCQIKRLVVELNRHGWTTPSLGLIAEQTIAGATATATHGSGRHCLSHYIRSLRLATYNAQGKPVITEITAGEELQAACCSLGSMGIVTSIVIPIRRQYLIEEHFRKYAELNAVLEADTAYPLQQFFFLPWAWTYLAQHRRETPSARSWTAPLYRAFWAWGMDRGLHWIVIALARWLPDFLCPLAYRSVLPLLVPRGWRVVDRSDRQLTMQHELYRHIETELFVKQSKLAAMLSLTQWVLEWCAGQERPACAEWAAAITECGISAEFKNLRGCYRQHYPICIRKVRADRGLVTMSGSDDDEAWFAVSFISYADPAKRAGFFQFAFVMTQLSGHLLAARPHWGKHGQLPPVGVAQLYPKYAKFIQIRDRLDPTNSFRPSWLK